MNSLKAAMKVICVSAVLCLLCVPCAAAVGGVQQPANRIFGDWLVSQLSGEPATLNPITSTDAFAGDVQRFIYEPLLKRDPQTMQLVPVLAERWSTSDDHLTYTFSLKKNIKWQDGTPFTAKDIRFSFDRIKDPKVDAPHLRNYYQDIEKLDVIDDYTVRFRYKVPYFLALEFCGEIPIVPAHLFKEGEDFNQHPIGRNPVGTGPYKLLHWETGKEIVLVRDENYWGEKPALDRIVFRIITNPTVALQVLKQGGLDEMALRPIQWVKQTQSKRFNQDFRKISYPNPSYSYIGWNMRRPIFSDRRVRQAMTMLVDRELILKKILFGLGTIVSSTFYINSPEYDKELKPYPYDPARALALLKTAGWSPRKGDGILQKDGILFEFEFLISAGSPFAEQLATVLQENLKDVGIKMSIRKLEWAVFVQRIEEHNFDACTLAWALGWSTDPYQLWHSSMAVDKGSNFVGFVNEEADRLMEEARREFDPQKRIQLYRRFQEIVYDEQPYTFLFTLQALQAVSRRFENVVIYPMGVSPLYWWVPREMQRYREP